MKQAHLNRSLGVACGALGLGIVFSGVVTGSAARADEPRVEGAAFVRLLHALSGGPKVDLFVDGQKKLNDVEFGSLSGYMRMPSGRHSFSVWSNGPARVLLAGERFFSQGSFTTLGAYGTAGRARLLWVDDSPGSQVLREGRLQVFNLSPSEAPLEVLASSKSAGTYPLSRRLRYGRSLWAAVPPEPTTLRVRLAGRTLKTINTFEPRGGHRYTAFILGRAGADLRVVLGEAGAP